MTYADGQEIRVGDIVSLGPDRHGTVVGCITDGIYSPDHTADHWAWLGQGFVVAFPAFGLIHYEQAEPDLRLVARAIA